MTLVDSSVWIEYLRGGSDRARAFVRERLGALHVTEPVLLKVLAGTRTGAPTLRAEHLLRSQRWESVEVSVDYRAAVDIYQRTRATGHRVRSLQDCLIAAVALRCGLDVAHRDADYGHIAAATGLDTVDLRD